MPLSYGIVAPALSLPWLTSPDYVVMLTATSRTEKLWDENHWITVGKALGERKLTPVFPAGNALERERAARLAAAIPNAIAAPSLDLRELAALLGNARLTLESIPDSSISRLRLEAHDCSVYRDGSGADWRLWPDGPKPWREEFSANRKPGANGRRTGTSLMARLAYTFISFWPSH